MPSLTIETPNNRTIASNNVSSGNTNSSPTSSRPRSPTQPPYSPITPTLSSARLASQTTYTHTQPPQTSIPQPPPIPVTLSQNPDAIAMQASISILLMQKRKAEKDIIDLQAIKERALQNPEEFLHALKSGGVRSAGDSLFNPSSSVSDDDEQEEADVKHEARGELGVKEKWPKIPTPQNVIRTPPVNWNKYAVVGESLDDLHEDQVKRPTGGVPQRIGSDGSLIPGMEVNRRPADLGIAAPFQPGRDKIEKMSTRKGGKR